MQSKYNNDNKSLQQIKLFEDSKIRSVWDEKRRTVGSGTDFILQGMDIYSSDDNKFYPLALPEENEEMFAKFKATNKTMQVFNRLYDSKSSGKCHASFKSGGKCPAQKKAV